MKWLGISVASILALSGCGRETAALQGPHGGEAATAESPKAAEAPANSGAEAPAGSRAEAPVGTRAEAPADSRVEAPAGTRAEAPADSPAEKPEPGDATAKPGTPATVNAQIRPGAADIEIVFGAEGRNVSVKVWGTDGLTLKGGATPVTRAAVKASESLKVSALYDAPTSQCNIAVSVSGTFGGKSQTTVRSFTINPSAPPAPKPTGEIKTDADGKRIKVIKAQ